MQASQNVSPDRRDFPRYHLRTRALLLLADGRQLFAKTLDISEGGIGLVCDANLAAGTRVGVWLNLQDRNGSVTPLKACAVVNNSRLASSDGGFRLGLYFRDLSDASLQAIRTFIHGR